MNTRVEDKNKNEKKIEDETKERIRNASSHTYVHTLGVPEIHLRRTPAAAAQWQSGSRAPALNTQEKKNLCPLRAQIYAL